MGSLRQEIGGDPGFDDTDVLEPLLPASSAGNAMPPIRADEYSICSNVSGELTDSEAKFTWALAQKDGGRLPQTIAHRGYKAKFPENTMASFKGAVDVGAHALETDIHLSSDGIVVLSHVRSVISLFFTEPADLTVDTGSDTGALLWYAR
jgi:hypothetical protein